MNFAFLKQQVQCKERSQSAKSELKVINKLYIQVLKTLYEYQRKKKVCFCCNNHSDCDSIKCLKKTTTNYLHVTLALLRRPVLKFKIKYNWQKLLTILAPVTSLDWLMMWYPACTTWHQRLNLDLPVRCNPSETPPPPLRLTTSSDATELTLSACVHWSCMYQKHWWMGPLRYSPPCPSFKWSSW